MKCGEVCRIRRRLKSRKVCRSLGPCWPLSDCGSGSWRSCGHGSWHWSGFGCFEKLLPLGPTFSLALAFAFSFALIPHIVWLIHAPRLIIIPLLWLPWFAILLFPHAAHEASTLDVDCLGIPTAQGQ